MVVLSLRDEGRLDIDAPLGEIAADLGALAQAGPDAAPVTVRQLLTMDAGLPQDDPWADRLMADENAWVSSELFARGATRSRAPGTAFEYSDYSWAALGRVIEAVTGRRHQDLVRERVLEPLGLRSTVWSAGELPPQQVATGYDPAGDGFAAEVPLADGGYFSALGGLYSSVRDLARWSGVFLDAEPPRDAPERAPVSRATLREIQRARSAFAPRVEWPSLAVPPGVVAGGYGYGLMIWHERDGQRHVGHPGGLPGFGTLMRWVPELGLSVILLANVTYAQCERPVRRALELISREAALPRRAIRRDPGLLAARSAVDSLIERWDDETATRLFAPNVDLDQPLSERRDELAALRERHGALVSEGDIDPDDALRGSWRLRGERGHVELAITLAPTVPPLVETLSVESVLPPSGPLGELAAIVCPPGERARRGEARRPARARGGGRRGPAGAASSRGPLRSVRRRRARRGRRRNDDHPPPAGPARCRRSRARAGLRDRPPEAPRAASSATALAWMHIQGSGTQFACLTLECAASRRHI